MASYRTSSPTPADIVTYRFRGNLVYVKPELDYEVHFTSYLQLQN